jgi:hypothetical protein
MKIVKNTAPRPQTPTRTPISAGAVRFAVIAVLITAAALVLALLR